ncbi:hypothetical protein T4A_6960 [Trichinella pseudospiralis]|uniref:Uncharacterized protein n=1 Tax=Trichinella pseudospiralis TaxID=6337 RepID=A0A0V1GAL7_TRIPS|nr:hypothetical protein T4A_6960 [Trichinella pseudospiralis]KRY95264.1 hypothetical protein T4C_8920 [Trichinella pseudospiralis]
MKSRENFCFLNVLENRYMSMISGQRCALLV